MDAAEILNQLPTQRLAKRGVASSIGAARRDGPGLPSGDRFVSGARACRAKPTPLFFIFHLLGDWREKAAYTASWRRFSMEIRTRSISHSRPQCRPVRPVPHVRSDRDACPTRRTRPGGCGPLSPRCLHGATASSAVLCLAGMAKRYCNARAERTPNPRQTGLRSRLHRPALDWVRWFPARSQMGGQAAGREPAPARQRIDELSRWYGFRDAYLADSERVDQAALQEMSLGLVDELQI
jgi:hypothetical protein